MHEIPECHNIPIHRLVILWGKIVDNLASVYFLLVEQDAEGELGQVKENHYDEEEGPGQHM